MDANRLFEQALAFGTGWKVSKSEMDVGKRRLSLWLDFDAGSQFPCPKCGQWCGVHDTREKRWRHLNFWQYETELIARVPRVMCGDDGVLQVDVPWARVGSGFTLMMEAMIVLMCQQMPVEDVARMIGEQDTRLWRVLMHYVLKAQAGRDWSKVRHLLVDETSAKRGHRYVTNFVDPESKELLFMTEGRSHEALEVFAQELRTHQGTPEQVEIICMDMSPAYRKGARQSFPRARIITDYFHVMQMAGKALDEVRTALRKDGAHLPDSLWAIRGNEWTRSDEQLDIRKRLCRQYPKLGRAMMLRDLLQDILKTEDAQHLQWWCTRARRSRLKPFIALANTIKAHWEEVTAFMETRLTNGLIEAINGLLQLAKRMARGFRSFVYFQTMAYLKCAKLQLDLPQLSPT